jgi:threonine dehydrogenase-like Zn-dependent dehydrogenase
MMQALTVTPGRQDSLQLRELPDPLQEDGPVLVEAVAVGLCGTDREIVAGAYGQTPVGESFLVLGHENLGRVSDAPAGSGLSAGDLVVGIVRRPDPVPCPACARGEWDMCRNGQYLEHGIKGLHGFARERWRTEPDGLVRLDAGLAEVGVLLEPATIVAKAWEQIDRIGAGRSLPRRRPLSPVPGQSACWPLFWVYSVGWRCMCSTGSLTVRNLAWSAISVLSTTLTPLPTRGCARR